MGWASNLIFVFIIICHHLYSARRPVMAGTRAQSGDRYGSGTLHIFVLCRKKNLLPLLEIKPRFISYPACSLVSILTTLSLLLAVTVNRKLKCTVLRVASDDIMSVTIGLKVLVNIDMQACTHTM